MSSRPETCHALDQHRIGLCPFHIDDSLFLNTLPNTLPVWPSSVFTLLANLTKFNQFLVYFSSPYSNPWHCFLTLTFSLPLHPHFGNSSLLHCLQDTMVSPRTHLYLRVIHPHEILPGLWSEYSQKRLIFVSQGVKMPKLGSMYLFLEQL